MTDSLAILTLANEDMKCSINCANCARTELLACVDKISWIKSNLFRYSIGNEIILIEENIEIIGNCWINEFVMKCIS